MIDNMGERPSPYVLVVLSMVIATTVIFGGFLLLFALDVVDPDAFIEDRFGFLGGEVLIILSAIIAWSLLHRFYPESFK
jgi:hypothetical protein